MTRVLRSIALATLSIAALTAHASVANVIDQSTPDGGTVLAFFSQSDLAQSFRQLADNITGAGIQLNGTAASSPASITIELWSQLPNRGGQRLAGGETLANSGDWADVFWPALTVTPDTTYFLVFKSSNSALGVSGHLNNPYPDGNTFATSGYGSFPNFDYAFRTYALAPAVPEPASWASLLGGLALIGGALAHRR